MALSGTTFSSTDTNTTYSAGTNMSLSGTTFSSTDTNTTYSVASSGTLGLVKIGYSESGKNYPVELTSEKMYVNVPWTDTDNNTTYTAGAGVGLSSTSFTWAGGTNLTADSNGGSLNAAISLTSVTCSGDITSNTSDVRLKDIQGTIDSPLEALSKLNGYYFKWNDKAKKL